MSHAVAYPSAKLLPCNMPTATARSRMPGRLTPDLRKTLAEVINGICIAFDCFAMESQHTSEALALPFDQHQHQRSCSRKLRSGLLLISELINADARRTGLTFDTDLRSIGLFRQSTTINVARHDCVVTVRWKRWVHFIMICAVECYPLRRKSVLWPLARVGRTCCALRYLWLFQRLSVTMGGEGRSRGILDQMQGQVIISH